MSELNGPAAELQGFQDQRIAGTISQADFLSHAERLWPLIEQGGSSPAPAVTGAQAAQSRMADLAQQRLEGKIGQSEYLAQIEQLGPQAHPQDVTYQAEDGSTETVDAGVQAELDKALALPADPAAYRFDTPCPDSEESRTWDSAVRAGFHAAGVPQSIANTIHATATKLQQTFERATPADVEQHVSRVGGQLRQQWGADFDARIARIDAMLDEVKGPLGQVLDELPWLIADPIVMNQLDALAEHRARKVK